VACSTVNFTFNFTVPSPSPLVSLSLIFGWPPVSSSDNSLVYIDVTLNLKARELFWILGRHSPLSLLNKTLIYKVILKPVLTYGIELWGCASSSNIEIIQRYQSKMLRLITQAPWYVTNQILHRDLRVAPVREIFKEKAKVHRKTLSSHPNSLMRPLTTQPPTRRLRRKWTFDGIK